MRWRQVYNKELGKYEMVPVDQAAANRSGHFIHADFDSFVSPIDGTVISGRKQYDNHCKKHNVVNAAEFDTHFEQKAQERADFYQGKRSTRESFHRKQEINEVINHLEAGGQPYDHRRNRID